MKKALSSNSGFTFIEIMVVVVIIGILATLVGTAVIGRIDEANIAKAKSDIATLQGSLQLYKLDNGNYPTTEQGLDLLVKPPAETEGSKTWKEGGYIEGGRLPLDSWKNQYQYLSPGVNNPNYDLWSMGKDGESGNEDDIQSWNLDKAWK
ncbi:MAG: type II secretion system protein GspG [Candidatus Schekmanbacteria bacterium RIFCSPHIGHO2_02_FULL_38_11]|uniref:Type II secretion system core protein G n=1 Tax=Candidatus Schekmanbacteria bacterium RIFCSPLOWO2_12_FULL_38_15 TaxID=1817883 RepID=A0A1F7SJ01_9BACT|nr:MAG: type II secretion system protein GspG [Candidatus Schekmanbacteria bacterium GWA2_38_9]OGL47901.1 MAG: type II secretion system protein GspG [Candidatus Schekmanbacteria bacterium RIFCSPLOWO2_02_FULL_38_14]OGL53751.1 MAG: type II secretion system protein GspG [Candidatus Schekmanbacteria bacterium RIFCSPLOWO2_12_FULL_38_15]OGL55507.1 MAG: type II secretion system protein GspG [Candidatus Schekmanbacteria bacterium RIFCSPHIGHO2_02_FULL_38_11]